MYTNEQLTEQVSVPLSEPQTEPLTELLSGNIYKLLTTNYKLINKLLPEWIENHKNKKEEKIIITANIFEEQNKQDIFDSWMDYRVKIKKPIKVQKSIDILINKFNEKNISEIEFVVNLSIENGWQGLFWEKYKSQQLETDNKPKKLSYSIKTT